MINEFEIWRSARLMISQFAERASAQAVQRATALEDRADVDGWIRWMRIAEAILEIQTARLHIASSTRITPEGG
jgi:hypothetical protein